MPFLIVLSFFMTQGTINAIAPPDYWPLQIGNSWTYHHIRSGPPEDPLASEFTVIEEYVTIAIIDVEQIDDYAYYRFNNGQLLRRDDIGNIIEYNTRFHNIKSGEMLLLDFAGSYEFFRFPYGAFPPTLGKADPPPSPAGRPQLQDSIAVPAGIFRVYTFDYSEGVDAVTDMSFAENIGLVRSRRYGDVAYEFETFSLIAATIGGRHLPNDTEVGAVPWGELKKGGMKIK